MIAGSYTGRSVQWQRVQDSGEALSCRSTHTAAYCQNSIDLMSCKDSPWTCISSLTLIKRCVLQKAYLECIYGMSSCSKILINFFRHRVLVWGGNHAVFSPLLLNMYIPGKNYITTSCKMRKTNVFQAILRALVYLMVKFGD